MASALVLTGATDLDALEASDVRPDYVLDSVADVLPAPGAAEGDAPSWVPAE